MDLPQLPVDCECCLEMPTPVINPRHAYRTGKIIEPAFDSRRLARTDAQQLTDREETYPCHRGTLPKPRVRPPASSLWHKIFGLIHVGGV